MLGVNLKKTATLKDLITP